jgi:RNA polymerase sigma-70 factor (ECF subfamily)
VAVASEGDRSHLPSGEWNWKLMRGIAVREARRYLGTAHDVDEVVQEALVRAWRRRGTCHGNDRMPWMRQIARNEALRLLERRRRRSEFELLDDERLLAAVADEDALQQQEGMLLRMEVEQVVGGLSVADRQLLALRYERDLTQPEVARMLGIPEGTVKIRLHRLRGRLRKALDAAA